MSNNPYLTCKRCKSVLDYVEGLRRDLDAKPYGDAWPANWDGVVVEENFKRYGLWIGEHESSLSTMGFLLAHGATVDLLEASMSRTQATREWLTKAADLLNAEILRNS